MVHCFPFVKQEYKGKKEKKKAAQLWKGVSGQLGDPPKYATELHRQVYRHISDI